MASLSPDVSPLPPNPCVPSCPPCLHTTPAATCPTRLSLGCRWSAAPLSSTRPSCCCTCMQPWASTCWAGCRASTPFASTTASRCGLFAGSIRVVWRLAASQLACLRVVMHVCSVYMRVCITSTIVLTPPVLCLLCLLCVRLVIDAHDGQTHRPVCWLRATTVVLCLLLRGALLQAASSSPAAPSCPRGCTRWLT